MGAGRHAKASLLVQSRAWPKLIPTPTASDANGAGSRNTPGSKAHPGVSLTDFVKGDGGKGRLWPTPTAGDQKRRGSAASTERRIEIGKQVSLEAAVKMWPTPNARDWKSEKVSEEFADERNAQTRGQSLSWAVSHGDKETFPTPTQQCAKGPSNTATREGSPDLQTKVGGGLSGQPGGLSADWVEALMGFPIGWTYISEKK